jgi:hypothetical protein
MHCGAKRNCQGTKVYVYVYMDFLHLIVWTEVVRSSRVVLSQMDGMKKLTHFCVLHEVSGFILIKVQDE